MITNTDIEIISAELKSRFPNPIRNAGYDWGKPSLNILDCIMSLNRNYTKVVKPRVEKFRQDNPTCYSIEDLLSLVTMYGLDYGRFTKEKLDLDYPERGRIIKEVSEYLLLEISNDNETDQMKKCENWAKNARPGDAYFVGIKGFGLSGFQYLRMLFGAQTTKPDVHLIEYISKVISKKVTDIQALYILEKASAKCGLPLRDVDHEIWKSRSKS